MIAINPDNIASVLDDLTEAGASDIKLKVGGPPWAYIGRDWLEQSAYQTLTGDMVELIHKKICRDERYKLPPEEGPFDGDYRTSSQRNNYRVSVGREMGRLFLVMRPLPRDIPDYTGLKLLDDTLGQTPPGVGHLSAGFDYVMKQKRGLVLVTGPTGSGKSTTLASMLDSVNRSRAYNIITVEDPIEFVFRGEKSSFLQREVGVDTSSFSDALRASLRQKPDIIMVGEMRDRETMEAALRAASTGHLVLSTLHQNEAAATIERIVSVFGTEQVRIRHELSEVLLGVFSQHIIKTTTGGMQVFHDAAVLTPTMRAILRPKEQDDTYLQSLRDAMGLKNPHGTRTLDSELRRGVKHGLIDLEVALDYVTQPAVFEKDLA